MSNINTINLWIKDPITEDNKVTFSAAVELPNGKSHNLWYQLPRAYADYVTDRADPYLRAILFWAMGLGHNIHVHGSVSSSLLQNLEDFQRTWVCWFPNKYTQVEMIADNHSRQSLDSKNELVCAFSGGVDSCYTVYRHRNDQPNRRNLTAGLIIQGFELSLEKVKEFEISCERAKVLLGSLGLDMIPMATNSQEFSHDWMFDYMSSLSSCLSLLGGKFCGGLIGGSRINTTSTTIAFPWGSNAVSDHLLSSAEFTIINDGGFFTRTQKINDIAQWEEANRYLQVCWNGKENLGNCGHCEKCIVNILNYRATLHPEPPCFPGELSIEEIENMRVQYITQIEDLIEILEEAYKNNLHEIGWVKSLEKVLQSRSSMEIQGAWKSHLLSEFRLDFVKKQAGSNLKEVV